MQPVGAVGSITGQGRFERIAGNPAMGYHALYEWDLYLSPSGPGYVGPSRRLGAPPGQAPTGDGYYRVDNVPAGLYSVYVNQPDFFASPKVVPNVTIANGATATVPVNLDVDYSTYFSNSNQWTGWEWDLYQTFLATGTSVRGISWRHAGGGSVYDGKSAVVSVLEDNGNPDVRAWTTVAQKTDSSIRGDTDEWVRFDSGEVPLAPGTRCAIKVHVDGGMAIYKRDKDASSYAHGRAYSGAGDAQNYDLNITVFVDRDGTIVTHTRKSSGPGNFDGSLNDTTWGQSFVATGTSLAAVDLFAAGASGYAVTWSLHEVGPGGAQVGPAKTVASAYFASSTALAGVSFNPGDVPLVPGSTYYVRAHTPSGITPFTAESWNAYPDGHAFKNGLARPALDLSMTIVEYGEPPMPEPPEIAEGLVAYWPFDGHLGDVSGNRHHGSFRGGAPSFVPAKLGEGLNLDGAGQYVQIRTAESNFDFVGQDLTVSAWCSTPAFTKQWQCLIAKGEESAWRIARHDTGNDLSWSGGVDDIFGGPDVTGGAMHHVVAITEHGLSTRLWVDGQLVATGGAPALADDSDMLLTIGENPEAPGREWEGRIDDLAIWNRALSRDEIALIWHGGAGASIGDLLAGAVPFLSGAAWNGGAFEVTAEGLDPAKSYVLQRNTDAAGGFADVPGAAVFTGGGSHTFVDPGPPAGTAVYVVREAP